MDTKRTPPQRDSQGRRRTWNILLLMTVIVAIWQPWNRGEADRQANDVGQMIAELQALKKEVSDLQQTRFINEVCAPILRSRSERPLKNRLFQVSTRLDQVSEELRVLQQTPEQGAEEERRKRQGLQRADFERLSGGLRPATPVGPGSPIYGASRFFIRSSFGNETKFTDRLRMFGIVHHYQVSNFEEAGTAETLPSHERMFGLRDVLERIAEDIVESRKLIDEDTSSLTVEARNQREDLETAVKTILDEETVLGRAVRRLLEHPSYSSSSSI